MNNLHVYNIFTEEQTSKGLGKELIPTAQRAITGKIRFDIYTA